MKLTKEMYISLHECNKERPVPLLIPCSERKNVAKINKIDKKKDKIQNVCSPYMSWPYDFNFYHSLGNSVDNKLIFFLFFSESRI